MDDALVGCALTMTCKTIFALTSLAIINYTLPTGPTELYLPLRQSLRLYPFLSVSAGYSLGANTSYSVGNP